MTGGEATEMDVETTRRSCSSYWAVLTLSAFALNWLWEMVQMPAYVGMADRPWRDALGICTRATLGDVVITWASYGIGALASGQWRWGMMTTWNVYATGSVLGALAAVGIEWRGLSSGTWAYTDHMPIIPWTVVGLWPFLQLTILVPLALGIAAWRQEHQVS